MRLPVFVLCWLGVNVVFAHGDLTIKIARVSEQIAAAPDSAALYLKRGQLYLQHREPGAARADLFVARRLDSALLITDILLAKVCIAEGRYPDALAYADTYLSARPEVPEAYAIRAGIYRRLDRPDRSAADMREALRLFSPPEPGHYIRITEAILLTDSTNVSEAITYLDQGLALFGQDIVLQSHKIDLLERSGQYAAALAAIDRLMEAFPRKERWLYRRGLLLEKTGDAAAARHAIRAAQAALLGLPTRLQRTTKMLELEADCLAALARLAHR